MKSVKIASGFLLKGIVIAIALGFIAYLGKYTIIPLGIYGALSFLMSVVSLFVIMMIQGNSVAKYIRNNLLNGIFSIQYISEIFDYEEYRDTILAFIAIYVTLIPANAYMLYLVESWGIAIRMWLHFVFVAFRIWTSFSIIVLSHWLYLLTVFLLNFLSEWIWAIFHINTQPVAAFFQGFWQELGLSYHQVANSASTARLEIPWIGEQPFIITGKIFANLGLGVLSGVLSTLVLNKLWKKNQ